MIWHWPTDAPASLPLQAHDRCGRNSIGCLNGGPTRATECGTVRNPLACSPVTRLYPGGGVRRLFTNLSVREWTTVFCPLMMKCSGCVRFPVATQPWRLWLGCVRTAWLANGCVANLPCAARSMRWMPVGSAGRIRCSRLPGAAAERG